MGNVEMPKMSISTGQAMLIAGVVAAVLVVLKLLTGYHSVDRAFGIYIAAVASLALAYGGFLAYKQDSGATRAR
jgi:hypothetical protein